MCSCIYHKRQHCADVPDHQIQQSTWPTDYIHVRYPFLYPEMPKMAVEQNVEINMGICFRISFSPAFMDRIKMKRSIWIRDSEIWSRAIFHPCRVILIRKKENMAFGLDLGYSSQKDGNLDSTSYPNKYTLILCNYFCNVITM